MDNVTIARYVGLGLTVVLFIITVILMPRIFGTARSEPTARRDDDAS